MPVVSRVVATLALGCVLASSLISPVTGSSVENRAKHHGKKHHHPSKANALAKRSGASKEGHCKSGVSTSVSLTAATTTTVHVSTSTTHKASTPTKAASTSGNNSGGGNAAPAQSGGGSTADLFHGVKQGLSWTWNNLNQDPYAKAASWCYNWGAQHSCSIDSKHPLVYMPQFWCTKTIGDWQDNVMGKKWDAILGHNEPNIGGQCNLSPQAAAAQWQQYIGPVDAGLKCSPAVTTGSEGMNWLIEFVQACKGCQIDRMCIHHYDITSQSFITQVEAFAKAFPGKKFWVTEIGCMDYSGKGEYCSQSMANAMLDGVMSYAYGAGDALIELIAWYLPAPTTNIDESNSMMTSSGGITPFAEAFLGYN